MTPQEKAKELVDKMYSTAGPYNYEGISWYEAIDCAIIAVDEILEITKKPTYNPFDWNEITGVYYDKYWIEVKQEIEKL